MASSQSSDIPSDVSPKKSHAQIPPDKILDNLAVRMHFATVDKDDQAINAICEQARTTIMDHDTTSKMSQDHLSVLKGFVDALDNDGSEISLDYKIGPFLNTAEHVWRREKYPLLQPEGKCPGEKGAYLRAVRDVKMWWLINDLDVNNRAYHVAARPEYAKRQFFLDESIVDGLETQHEFLADLERDVRDHIEEQSESRLLKSSWAGRISFDQALEERMVVLETSARRIAATVHVHYRKWQARFESHFVQCRDPGSIFIDLDHATQILVMRQVLG